MRVAAFSVGCLLPITLLAATVTIEAFDFKRCIHWYIGSDSCITRDPRDTRKCEIAQARMDKALASSRDRDEWEIFSAYQVDGSSKRGRYAACKLPSTGRTFECLPGFDFPLSGQKFVLAKSKGELPTLRCATGCRGANVSAIHDMGYENMEGEMNAEHDQNRRRFARTCRPRATKAENQ